MLLASSKVFPSLMVGDDASIFRLFQAVFKSFKVLGGVQKSLNHFWIRKRDIQLTGLYTLLHTYK